eukprot:TRINITY_DN11378_c0_g1_i1.p2 TRINITY_DN11378_c0_g1~~TRINITY_DN11378_c0_g1_i1.p2  ORF type:complete len:108 (+),score=22.68 TRINITY_DN11378_c0_g1_i1:518-841(+)
MSMFFFGSRFFRGRHVYSIRYYPDRTVEITTYGWFSPNRVIRVPIEHIQGVWDPKAQQYSFNIRGIRMYWIAPCKEAKYDQEVVRRVMKGDPNFRLALAEDSIASHF